MVYTRPCFLKTDIDLLDIGDDHLTFFFLGWGGVGAMLLFPELEKKNYAEQNHNIFLHENVVFKKIFFSQISVYCGDRKLTHTQN